MKVNQNGKTGAAMFSVLLLVLVVTPLLTAILQSGVQKALMARRLGDQTRAMAIAEAGASEAYAILANDISKLDDPSAFPLRSYAGGTYDACVSRAGGPLLVVLCTGKFANAEERVLLDLHYEPAGSIAAKQAYECTILANGDITWTGDGEFLNDGKVHTNAEFTQSGNGELDCDVYALTDIRLNGQAGGIYADVYSPIVSGKTNKISGDIYIEPVDVIELPDINLAPYIQHAIANGQAYSNGLTIATGDFNPPGGIVYVTGGDLKISTGGDVSACFISDGDIQLTGQMTHTQVENYPAFVSWNGDLEISGGGSFEGLMYAVHGDAKVTGACELTGSLMCGGDLTKSGGGAVFSYASVIAEEPGGGGKEQVLALSAWQK